VETQKVVEQEVGRDNQGCSQDLSELGFVIKGLIDFGQLHLHLLKDVGTMQDIPEVVKTVSLYGYVSIKRETFFLPKPRGQHSGCESERKREGRP
jgi:hypothetical protein